MAIVASIPCLLIFMIGLQEQEFSCTAGENREQKKPNRKHLKVKSAQECRRIENISKLEGCSIRNTTCMKLALNMLLHSKLRSWLTIIGIVIGVGAVVGIISLGDAMQKQGAEQACLHGPCKYHDNSWILESSVAYGHGRMCGGRYTTDTQLTDHDIDALRGIKGIMYASGEISGREGIKLQWRKCNPFYQRSGSSGLEVHEHS